MERTRYQPFGGIISGGVSRNLYTGQEWDPDTGQYYYNARYYNPELRRFTQADTVIPNVYDPQSLNRYTYVNNNPIKLIDPSGNRPILISNDDDTEITVVSDKGWYVKIQGKIENEVVYYDENDNPVGYDYQVLISTDTPFTKALGLKPQPKRAMLSSLIKESEGELFDFKTEKYDRLKQAGNIILSATPILNKFKSGSKALKTGAAVDRALDYSQLANDVYDNEDTKTLAADALEVSPGVGDIIGFGRSVYDAAAYENPGIKSFEEIPYNGPSYPVYNRIPNQ